MLACWIGASTSAIAEPASSKTLHSAPPRIALSPPVTTADGRFTIRTETGLEKKLETARALIPQAVEDARSDLPGLPRIKSAEVYVVNQQSDMAKVAPKTHPPPAWAQGVTYPKKNLIIVALRREHETLEWEGTLRHEVAHLVLHHAVGENTPRWLEEGFAFLHARNLSMDRVRILTGMAWSGHPFPLSQLSTHYPKSRAKVDRAYAQSYDFVSFLARRGRHVDSGDDYDRWAFRDFLTALADGSTVEKASLDIYNAPLSTLEKEWFQDLRKRYWMLPIGLFGGGLWLFASIVLILAFHRKRRISRATLARWQKEEELLAQSEALESK